MFPYASKLKSYNVLLIRLTSINILDLLKKYQGVFYHWQRIEIPNLKTV